MTPLPTESELDELNAYLDGLMDDDARVAYESRLAAEPRLRDLHADHAAMQERLDTAFSAVSFDAAGTVAAVMRQVRADAAPAADAEPVAAGPVSAVAAAPAPAASPAPATAPVGRIGFATWAGRVAAVLLLVGSVSFLAVRTAQDRGADLMDPSGMYVSLVDEGFIAPRTCSVEEFPTRMKRATGVPLVLASVPAGFDVLGWSYPGFYGGPVLSKDEIVLMAKVNGEPVAVVLDAANDDRDFTPADDRLRVHRARLGTLVGVEVSPFAEPRVLPLLQVPGADAAAPAPAAGGFSGRL